MSRTLEPLVLSNVELVFLAGLFGVVHLVGTPDPFRGWLTEEIRPALEEARAALAHRGLITLLEDGTIHANPAAEALVRVVGAPVASFVFSHAPEGAASTVRYIHTTKDLVVEQVVDQQAATSTLTPMENVQAALSRLRDLLMLEGQSGGPGALGALPAAKFNEIRAAAPQSGADEATAALVNAGISPEAAAPFALALIKPLGSSVLMSLTEGPGVAANVTLFWGSSGLWRLHLYVHKGEHWVEFKPCSGAEADAAVAEVLRQGSPAA